MKTTVWMLATLALTATSSAARADASESAADALFQQGIADLQAGNTEQACRELKGSLDQHADSGTEGALATCYTKLGKIASAWTLWRRLADTQKDPMFQQDAAQKAAALGPRLPHFVIKLAGAPVPGLVVKIADVDVDPTLVVPLPVDPGDFVATATAPGYQPWTKSFTATEAAVTTVELPAMVRDPSTVISVGGVQVSAPQAHASETRRWVGIGLAGGGAVALVAGAAMLIQGHSQYSDSGCLPDGGCHNPTELAAAGRADDRSNLGLGFAIGGVALAATGVAIWLTGRGESEAPSTTHTTFRLVPSPSGIAATLSGSFQ